MYVFFTIHMQVAKYTDGSNLEWREVESGNLPTPRWGLRAALVDNIIHVTGGYGHPNYFTSILAWNSTKESWQNVSDLDVGRSFHAAVAVPWGIGPIIERNLARIQSTSAAGGVCSTLPC